MDVGARQVRWSISQNAELRGISPTQPIENGLKKKKNPVHLIMDVQHLVESVPERFKAVRKAKGRPSQ